MRSEADPARERSWDECLFKNRIDNRKYRMVHHAITHGRLMDMPLFRIANVEPSIGAMLIGFILEIPMQLKDIHLEVLLKLHYIRLLPLVAFKGLP